MDRRKKFILELMGDPIYQPMRLREISSLLRLSKEEKRELYDVLDELCEEGKVSVDRKGRYEKVKGKWKKKKDDRYYDDRREEYGSEYGRKKKDKNKKEQLEGIQAEGTFIGHPKGFGFVEMPDDAAGQKAIDELNGAEFDHKQISVNVARPREERPSNGGNRDRRGGYNSRRY